MEKNDTKKGNASGNTLFDEIDAYFRGYEAICLGLNMIPIKCRKPDLVNDDPFDRSDIFQCSIDSLKKRIASELFYNPSAQSILGRYIVGWFNTIKSHLMLFDNLKDEYKILPFPASKRYLENCSFRKTIFFCSTELWGTNDNPKDPTYYDIYNQTYKELIADYHSLGELFSNKKSDSSDNDEGRLKSKIYLSNKKGMRIDYIRVINCLYELRFFVDSDGNEITKKDVFYEFGSAINKDLSSFQNDLSTTNASSNNDMISISKIYHTMIDKQEELNNKK